MSILYGIGVGPGDKELVTIKALNAIKNSDVIVAPSAEDGGESIALQTVEDYIEGNKKIYKMHFPMGKADKEEKIKKIYELIYKELKNGNNVSFLTIGDPYVYSTYIHLLTYIKSKGFEVITIAGITSFCAAASLVNQTLVVGNEPLLVLPAARISDIKDEKYVVIMKVYKNEEKVINTLEEKGFNYVLVSRVGRDGEVILTKKEDILAHRDYMSLIIANRE